MKHSRQIIRHATIGLALCGALLVGGSLERTEAQSTKETKEQPQPSKGRDPFLKYAPPVKSKPNKPVATVKEPPPVQERIDRYKAQKVQAMNSQQPAPKPTTALLLNEIQVMGITRTPRGWAAMVEALPIKLSYVIYPGEMFFDGQLVAIEENRLVFRRTVLYSDGRREMVVETKPLRQANAVVDSLAASRGTSSAGSSAPTGPAGDESSVVPPKMAVPEKQ
jgi:hypothetical protein